MRKWNLSKTMCSKSHNDIRVGLGPIQVHLALESVLLAPVLDWPPIWETRVGDTARIRWKKFPWDRCFRLSWSSCHSGSKLSYLHPGVPLADHLTVLPHVTQTKAAGGPGLFCTTEWRLSLLCSASKFALFSNMNYGLVLICSMAIKCSLLHWVRATSGYT